MDSILPSRGIAKKVLLLGAGFVTRPTAQILSDNDIQVTVACRTLERAQGLAKGIKNAHPISLDVENQEALDAEVAKNALVISLIPYTLHATVIKSAIRQKRDVVTTSYVSPAMMELDQQCKDAGITVLNEIGLDPGIDHLAAVRTIDEVHKEGGKIVSFLSFCGGLPAPSCSDNPLGYRFSWSSRGVLLALRNAAKYYQDGKVVEVQSKELMGTAKPYTTGYLGYNFVAYPNRDSTPYRERYNIPEANTIIRGTLRYGGFTEQIRTLVDINFLDDTAKDYLSPDSKLTWQELTAKLLGASETSENDLIWAISSATSFASTEEKENVIAGLRWMGLFSEDLVAPKGNPLDTLCARLESLMAYEKGQKDMVFLQHKFGIEHANGKKETRTSTLIEYGTDEMSAMAKTVGTPCAVAVLKVLDGTITEKGVLAPMKADINEPIMKELEDKYGIFLTDKTLA